MLHNYIKKATSNYTVSYIFIFIYLYIQEYVKDLAETETNCKPHTSMHAHSQILVSKTSER